MLIPKFGYEKYSSIPVIDYLPTGGLGEGFSSYGNEKPKFKIALSIEKEITHIKL